MGSVSQRRAAGTRLAWICATKYRILQSPIVGLAPKTQLKFDGKSGQDVLIQAKLIDDFTYRSPLVLTADAGTQISDLNGETVCQCASSQFDQKDMDDDKDSFAGEILLRPKSTDVTQTLHTFATLLTNQSEQTYRAATQSTRTLKRCPVGSSSNRT